MERVKGIEPSQSAWKAEVLPLNYTRKCQHQSNLMLMVFVILVPEAGLEPAQTNVRWILSPLCLPIPPLGHHWYAV